MDIRKLQRVIVDGLEDVKAQNIVVFNTEHLSALFERVIIASGTSNRQTRSLAASVREAVKAAGYSAPRVEGEANGEWIIVDCGAAVVHVMQPAIREYYHLEELWGEKPVKMKLDSGAAPSTRTAGPDRPVRTPATAAQKVAAERPAAKNAGGARTGDAGVPAPAKPPAARPLPARRRRNRLLCRSKTARSGAHRRRSRRRASGLPRLAGAKSSGGVKRSGGEIDVVCTCSGSTGLIPGRRRREERSRRRKTRSAL